MSNVTPLFAMPPQPKTAFDDFWAVYPRKVAKGDARRAWQKAIRVASPEEIIAGAMRYARKAEPPFICHPATWLNAERWADEDEPQVQIVDQQESRLRMMASMVKKRGTSRFYDDWISANVTERDLETLRERGMI